METFDEHLRRQEQRRAKRREELRRVAEAGARMGLWTVAEVGGGDGWSARATVERDGMKFALWAHLDDGTVSAYPAAVRDAGGRNIIPRDVLPPGVAAPSEPRASLDRGPEAVARDLSRRCVNNAEWRAVVGKMMARREASYAYAAALGASVDTVRVALGLPPRESSAHHSEAIIYPQGFRWVSRVTVGADRVKIELTGMPVADALRLLGSLRVNQSTEGEH